MGISRRNGFGVRWLGCVLLFVAAAAGLGGCSAQDDVQAPKEGSARGPAPDFELGDLAGQSQKLSAYRGKVVLLNFWAVGCGPCRQEIPHLKDLYKKYADRGLVILGVNAWNESPAIVREFSRSQKIEYPVLLSGHEVWKNKFGGSAVPMTIVVDRQGETALTLIGFDHSRRKALGKKLEQLFGA